MFENARQYGLILLEDGSLVDTTRGETIPDGKRPMPATTDDDVRRLDTLRADEMGHCVVTRGELDATPCAALPGLRECPVIGAASESEGLAAGKIAWQHGFQVRYVEIDPGSSSPLHVRHEEEVFLMHSGSLQVSLPDGDVVLGPGDVLTVPVGAPRRFSNSGSAAVQAYVVRGGDQPKPPTLTN